LGSRKSRIRSFRRSRGHIRRVKPILTIPAKAKQLLDEAGFRDPDGDGPRMRFEKPIVYKLSGSSIAGRQYAGVIQNALKEVGVPVEIQTPEQNTLFDELRRGNFQIAYSQWVGGNQDPIFYKDLFATSEIPTQTRPSRNRSRYSNKELDALLEEAVNTFDRAKARELYVKIQDIVSRDVPILSVVVPVQHRDRAEECAEHSGECERRLGIRAESEPVRRVSRKGAKVDAKKRKGRTAKKFFFAALRLPLRLCVKLFSKTL
jgi:hypothetical protein